MSSNQLFSLQGKVYSAIRNTTTGAPGALTWLGNVSKAEIALSPTISDKYESYSGQRLLAGRLMKERKGDLNMTMDEFKIQNLVLGLFNTAPISIAGSTVTGEVFPSGLVIGNSVQLGTQAIFF